MTDTKQINTGGAAFPCEGGTDSGLHPDAGMSLRDYFAAKAMQAIYSNSDLFESMRRLAKGLGMTVAYIISKSAYDQADAMIAARGGAQ